VNTTEGSVEGLFQGAINNYGMKILTIMNKSRSITNYGDSFYSSNPISRMSSPSNCSLSISNYDKNGCFCKKKIISQFKPNYVKPNN